MLAAPDTALGGSGGWTEVIPHRPGVRIEDVDAFTGTLVLSERAEALTRVRVLPLLAGDEPLGGDLLEGGWIIESVESPSSTWLGGNPEPDAPALRFGRTSMKTPSSVLQITLDTRQETLLKQEPVLGDFDPDRYVTSREWASAPDGTRVPLSVLRRKDVELPAPVLLYGYGAYEISIDPTFSPHRLSLCDRGVVFAIAHVRGGGEMGRAWYEAAAWSTRPTPSRTSSPAPAISSMPASPGRDRWPGGAAPPAGSSSVPSPTRRRTCSGRWWPKCPSSTA